MNAPDVVWIAVRDGSRLGVFASEAGAKACAEAKYREMCEYYKRPVGRTQWRPCVCYGKGQRPDVQDLYVTYPNQADHFGNSNEMVTRVEVRP